MANFSISNQIIIEEAKKRGILVQVICLGRIAKLSYEGHDEYLAFQIFSRTSSIALSALNHKDITKEMLKNSGISVAEGKVFEASAPSSGSSYAKEIKFPVVMKPVSAYGGKCVFVDISTEDELLSRWNEIADKYKYILIEKYFKGGSEYRVLASRDRVLAVTNRVPANVVGDGIHTVKELVDIKNSDPRRGDSSYKDLNKPLVKIIIDDAVRDYLKKNGIDLDLVPEIGRIVFLRENSNLSTGGDSVDFTDKIHPSVEEICVRAIRSIPGLDYAGIDFLTLDVSKEQGKDDYIIIEMNSNPGIFMHHFPYEGTSRNVAGEILDIAFPETKEASK